MQSIKFGDNNANCGHTIGVTTRRYINPMRMCGSCAGSLHWSQVDIRARALTGSMVSGIGFQKQGSGGSGRVVMQIRLSCFAPGIRE